MELVIAFGFGFMVGFFILYITFCLKSVGSLRIDKSDLEDEPYLFLELYKNVEHLLKKKYVVLKVDSKNFIPRK